MRITKSWMNENGFDEGIFHCWLRLPKRTCPKGSKPVRIEVELIENKTVCFIHIGKCSHRVNVNSCSDLLRIIEVFENEEEL